MVSVKGTASKLEMEILGGIIEPNCPNIEFKNVTFDCKSIKDAAGHIFINQTYCNESDKKEVKDDNPLRHGHWIDEGAYADYTNVHAWRCSECEDHVLNYKCDLSRYCPNCGAKMDGENDE